MMRNGGRARASSMRSAGTLYCQHYPKDTLFSQCGLAHRPATRQHHGQKLSLLGMGGARMTQAATAVTRIPFVSTCPRCGDERAPVEGYCVICQEYWQLNSQERRDLAAKLAN